MGQGWHIVATPQGGRTDQRLSMVVIVEGRQGSATLPWLVVWARKPTLQRRSRIANAVGTPPLSAISQHKAAQQPLLADHGQNQHRVMLFTVENPTG